MRAASKPGCAKGSAMAILDLPAPYREQLVDLFRRHVPAAEVWAYGSRLKGWSHATSDLDLVVRNPADPSRSQEAYWRLRDALSESDIPILVEILDWATIPQSFRDEILRDHVVLYPSSDQVS